jgi:hypothetical protein
MGKDLKFIEWDLLTTFFIDNRKEFMSHCLDFGHNKQEAKTIYLDIGRWLLTQEPVCKNDDFDICFPKQVCHGREADGRGKPKNKGVTWENKQ